MSDPAEDLARVLRRMVDYPNRVEVEVLEDGETTVLEATGAPSDLGKMIGRQGRTVEALRALLRQRGMGEGREYELEVIES